MDKKKKNIIELSKIGISEYRDIRKKNVILLVDSVRSMMNIGSLFRTADAFMIEEILLCGISGCPPHPEIHKTALGAEESVKWSYERDALSAAKNLQLEGWKICVLEQAHSSIELQDFQCREDEKYALVVGNEVEGVNQAIIDLADYILEIPQYGTKHSLNVAVSGAIALWHLTTHLP